MNKAQRLKAMNKAQRHLFEAIKLIRATFPNDVYVEVHMVAPLEIRATTDTDYLAEIDEISIDDLKARIEDE